MDTNKLEGCTAESVEAILDRLTGRNPESLSGHDLALAACLNEDAAFARPLAESWEHACSWLVRRAIDLARGGAAHALSTRGLALQRAGRAVALDGESAPESPLVRAAGLLLARLFTAGAVPLEELAQMRPRRGCLRAHSTCAAHT